MLGLILLGIEVVVPGFFFLWFGIAAILIGVSALLIDWPWQWQVLGFVVLSVIAALVGRRFAGNPDVDDRGPAPEPPGEPAAGRTFVLSSRSRRERARAGRRLGVAGARAGCAGRHARRVTGADGPILSRCR